MVVDKPDWSQASYQEMNDLVIKQGSIIAERDRRIAELEVCVLMVAHGHMEKRIAELEAFLKMLLYSQNAHLIGYAIAEEAEQLLEKGKQ